MFGERPQAAPEVFKEIQTVEIEEKAVSGSKGTSELGPIYVKSMELHSLADVKGAADELRAGNIMVLDITTLMNQDPAELKRAIDQLKGICQAIGGDVGRLTESKVIVTPRFINIQFKKVA